MEIVRGRHGDRQGTSGGWGEKLTIVESEKCALYVWRGQEQILNVFVWGGGEGLVELFST